VGDDAALGGRKKRRFLGLYTGREIGPWSYPKKENLHRLPNFGKWILWQGGGAISVAGGLHAASPSENAASQAKDQANLSRDACEEGRWEMDLEGSKTRADTLPGRNGGGGKNGKKNEGSSSGKNTSGGLVVRSIFWIFRICERGLGRGVRDEGPGR